MGRAAREAALVAAVAGALVLLSRVSLDQSSAAIHHEGLTIAAAAVGAAAAIVADLAARLADRPRIAWSGAALAVYSVVVIPATALGSDRPQPDAGLTTLAILAHLTVLLLFLLAARSSGPGGAWVGWSIAAGGTAAAVLAGQVVAFAELGIADAVLRTVVPVLAIGGWSWLAAVYLQQGLRFGRRTRWRIGIGLAVLAGAQAYRVATGTGLAEPNIAYSSLRLLGLVVILATVIAYWIGALRQVRDQHEDQTAHLQGAIQQLRDVVASGARRDHELRNGIGGLVGITELLSSTDEESRTLRVAVLEEIRRLSRMVEAGPRGPGGHSDVSAVLRQAAALHRVGGHEVMLAVPDGLRAQIPDAALRQIVTNLLANARRHAPAAAVGCARGAPRASSSSRCATTGRGCRPGRRRRCSTRARATRAGAGAAWGWASRAASRRRTTARW